MKTATLALAFLVALALVLTGQQVRAADDETAYTVTVNKVEIKKTKADGSAWDINEGKPDLAVNIRNVDVKDEKTFTTKTKDDTFAAEFNEPTTVKIRPGQTLEFEVVDKDVAVNDTAGKISKKMTAEILKGGKMKLEKFGQVILLEVEFKKL